MSALYRGGHYHGRFHSGRKQKHSQEDSTSFSPYMEAKLQIQPQPKITKMMHMSKENIEGYNTVLSSIGCRKIALNSFYIDKSGYSKEVAAILGKDYLKNNIVIVSPKQSNAPLVREDYSFLEELTNRVYSDAQNLIKAITPKEPLYGGIEIMSDSIPCPEVAMNLYSVLNSNVDCNSQNKEKFNKFLQRRGKLDSTRAKEKEPKFSIAVVLDTPDRTLSKLEDVVNEIDSLDENKDLVLNTNYITSIFDKIAGLNEKYGNIRHLKVKSPHLAFDIPSFVLSRSKYAIYGFASKNDKKSEESEKPKSNENLIVYLGKSCPEEWNEGAKIKGTFYASNIDVLLGELMDSGCIQVDKDLIEKTLRDMERQTLEKSHLNFEHLDLMERYKKLEELKEKLPNEFGELWKAVKDRGYFNKLDRKLRFKITKQTNKRGQCFNKAVRKDKMRQSVYRIVE